MRVSLLRERLGARVARARDDVTGDVTEQILMIVLVALVTSLCDESACCQSDRNDRTTFDKFFKRLVCR